MSETASVHVVRLADAVSTPWRNGGGRTRELHAWPGPGGTSGDWQLRVSVAEIERDGPFSAFPGVQRWFGVLEGAGVRLHLPGGAARVVRDGEPLAFDGGAAPDCELLDGPTRDLNFMLRPSAGLGSMSRAHPGSALHGALAWRGLFTLGAADLHLEAGPLALESGSLAWSDAPAPASWTLHRGGPAWWLALLPP